MTPCLWKSIMNWGHKTNLKFTIKSKESRVNDELWCHDVILQNDVMTPLATLWSMTTSLLSSYWWTTIEATIEAIKTNNLPILGASPSPSECWNLQIYCLICFANLSRNNSISNLKQIYTWNFIRLNSRMHTSAIKKYAMFMEVTLGGNTIFIDQTITCFLFTKFILFM